ncbi:MULTISPECIES: ATP-binding protein [unclassified Moorena]|uniref:ATP-binding protein n=1 Tax=unclassified Moorena TaxID=2683338 RepID=UPI0025FC34E0|nr:MULTISPECIES: ATP-binding protein [unclassified Moorena]
MALDLLSEIYSSFEPFRPALKEVYVDCQDVRGDWEVIRELGLKIRRSKQPTCQLYTGHRGVGKSTELLRLKDYLEEQKYFVVYFAADDEDIEPQDADYADILLACTRHLVEEIKVKEHNPLLNWMKDRWASLQDIALTEVAFDGLSLEGQISQFAKITTNLRATPDKRRELRQKVNANTPSLVKALNDFIKEAQNSLSADSQGIVLIVDNLDRMGETQEIGKPSNYDEIYLNHSEMLGNLACHVIYTVPIKMVYSGRATQLENNYDKPDVLPMIMIRNPDGTENKLGLDKMRELICRRIALIEPNLLQTLEGKVDGLDFPPVFDNGQTLKNLCLMSGGHVRNLMQLIQKAIDWTDELPITGKAAKRAIEETRETYQKTVQESEWETLARACHLKQAYNDDAHLDLLFKRCLLEYHYHDQNKNLHIWRNVHPLIAGIPRFQNELAKVRAL